jgi:hypothetical protein
MTSIKSLNDCDAGVASALLIVELVKANIATLSNNIFNFFT